MRRLILVVALFAAAPVAADVVQPARRACAVDDRVLAVARPGSDGLRRLDQLPPANAHLAVYRTVDRRPAPVVVRFDVAPRR